MKCIDRGFAVLVAEPGVIDLRRLVDLSPAVV
jgi:hypothetical protein